MKAIRYKKQAHCQAGEEPSYWHYTFVYIPSRKIVLRHESNRDTISVFYSEKELLAEGKRVERALNRGKTELPTDGDHVSGTYSFDDFCYVPMEEGRLEILLKCAEKSKTYTNAIDILQKDNKEVTKKYKELLETYEDKKKRSA